MFPLPTTKKIVVVEFFYISEFQIKLTFKSCLDIWFVVKGAVNRREPEAASEACPWYMTLQQYS